MKRTPTRREDAQPDGVREKRSYGRCRVEDVLEVVEQQQYVLSLQEAGQAVAGTDGLRDLRLDEPRLSESREWHPEHPVAERPDELGRDLQGEARLPGSARPGDGHLPCVGAEKRNYLRELALAPDERARRERQVRGVERLERGKVAASELKQLLCRAEVLEAMLPEVAKLHRVTQHRPRRRGDDDLAAVPTRRDPRRVVDVETDVALVGSERLARVETHSHPHRSGRQRGLPFDGGCGCVAGRAEHEEERISLRVHLDPVVAVESVAEQSSMLGEQICVVGPVAL